MSRVRWKFIAGAEPQGSSSGFWYDLTNGGYIKLDEAIADPQQLKAAQDAVNLLADLETAMYDAGLIAEF